MALLANDLNPKQTAVVSVDMWDTHACSTATKRVEKLAKRMNPFLHRLRQVGVQTIFMPYGVTGAYARMPVYIRPPDVSVPKQVNFHPPPPPKQGEMSCACQRLAIKCIRRQPKRQTPLLDIVPGDVMFEENLYSFCQDRNIENLLYVGQATNLCILYRSFGMIEMIRAGLNCRLIGDMSITQLSRGDMSVEDEHSLVLEHIAEHIAPVINSRDLFGAPMSQAVKECCA